MNELLADSMSSRPEVPSSRCTRAPGWLPLTHDIRGNHIGIDFDPDVRGMVGQVIIFGRDEDEKKLLAPSFEAFLSLFVHQLRTVEWQVTADGWTIDERYGDHYHDWPRGQPSDRGVRARGSRGRGCRRPPRPVGWSG